MQTKDIELNALEHLEEIATRDAKNENWSPESRTKAKNIALEIRSEIDIFEPGKKLGERQRMIHAAALLQEKEEIPKRDNEDIVKRREQLQDIQRKLQSIDCPTTYFQLYD